MRGLVGAALDYRRRQGALVQAIRDSLEYTGERSHIVRRTAVAYVVARKLGVSVTPKFHGSLNRAAVEAGVELYLRDNARYFRGVRLKAMP